MADLANFIVIARDIWGSSYSGTGPDFERFVRNQSSEEQISKNDSVDLR